MAWNRSTILLIDPDDVAALELADLFWNHPQSPTLYVFSDVRSAEPVLRSGTVDWMFIRIVVWDDFQRLRPLLTSMPRRIVFLSGRNEKCTAHLPLMLDSHLQPPYRPGHLVRTWNKWTDPHFIPRPLDIFFIKSRARFEPVRYGDLRQVEVEKGKLRLLTRHADYHVTGSLQAFQDRLPISLALVRRGCLVNEFYRHNGAQESHATIQDCRDAATKSLYRVSSGTSVG